MQARVDAVIAALEGANDRQHPLRRIPMDLVAEAVEIDAAALGLQALDLTPAQVAHVLQRILERQTHNSAVWRLPEDIDRVGPEQGSSYLPHAGPAWRET